ncbi:MAG TPA: GNAT family N-acetyltransferase [Chloroflexota bacterium]
MTSATDVSQRTPTEAPRGERRITEFRPEDAAAVAAMFNGSSEGWPDGFGDGTPWTVDMVLDMQSSRQPLATFLSWEGEDVAGYCSFYEYPGEVGLAGYVGLLNAATRFHGRGHGRDLLKAALQRCLDLGYRRVDLHTWQGNMKAVPLYKKSGYFWVPESSVHMENYLPLLLRIPALADFWAQADWYQTQVRQLAVQEDLFLDGKMRVYPYEFRSGNRFVKATIDATARGLTALETERWRIACRVDDRHLVIGRSRTVYWEVENRSGQPLNLTLLATAGPGLHLQKEETVTVTDRYVAEAVLTADAAYQPPAPGQLPPCVESLLLIDGLPVRLETGVQVKQPVEIRLLPRRASLLTGQTRTLTLQLQNHLDEAVTVDLRLAPSAGLSLEGPGGTPLPPISLAAQSYGGADIRLRATESGVQTLVILAVATVGAERIEMPALHLPLPALRPGEILAFETEAPTSMHTERDVRNREVRVETATHRLIVELVAGGLSLEDAATGAHLGGVRLLAGPPFSWVAQSRVVHEASFEQTEGGLTVHLRGATPHLPHAVVEHELHLTNGGLLRLATAVTNMGDAPLEAQSGLESWAGGTLPTLVLPTAYGLIATSMPEFPDWSDLDLQKPATFLETWVAREGEGRVAGLFWSEASRIEPSGWGLAELKQETGALQPGERRLLPPAYLYAGPGDRSTVRALWRHLIAPEAPERMPAPRDTVTLINAAAPAVAVAATANQLTLSSVTSAQLQGRLEWSAPAGWAVEPQTADISGLRLGHDQLVVAHMRHADPRPAAAPVHATFRSERIKQQVFEGAVLDLGEHAGGVTVSEREQDGQPVWTVANGFLRFRLAPQFLGSIIALETLADGVNHLRSAFPEAREFGWMRPWFGGIYAAVYRPGRGHFPDPARLYEEHFTVAPADAAGHDGRRWQGVRVRSTLQSQGLRGLEMEATYLTLPGSNLLALWLTLRNHTSATLPVDAALVAYLQPGGSTDEGELLLDPQGARRLLRVQRTIGVRTDGWAASRNPRDGRTVALVAGAADIESSVEGLDWGKLGAHLALRGDFHLRPQGELSALAYLALAQNEEEAGAYRALRGAKLL